MNTISFSSWNGNILDNRNSEISNSENFSDVTIPVQLDGHKITALMGWNGLVIVDAKADIPSLTMGYLKEARKMSCGECSVCMIGIDMVTDILRGMVSGKGTEKNLSDVEEICKGVSVNSKCNFGRSTALTPVLDAVKYYKNDFLDLVKREKRLTEKPYTWAVTAPCMQKCPASLDIPGYIELIKNNRLSESLDLIRQRCILPGVIGRACTHPCEGACIRKDIDAPLSIRLLKKAAADEDLRKNGSILPLPQKENPDRVAIIGSGPAGLAAGYQLRRMGYQVTIFEAMSKAGGMAAVGIPDYRLPKDILNHEIDLIKQMGVEIKLDFRIKKLDVSSLKQMGYKAIFISVGAHMGTKIGCKGEETSSKDFIQGVEFLRNLSLDERITPLNKVVIIGGGNVALDCARNAVRLGFKEVDIVYRRSRVEMPARREEIEEAEQEGIKLNYLMAPVNILRKDGKVNGVECIRMELGDPDESGRRKPVPIKGTEFIIETDIVIAATGQKPDLAFLAREDKIDLTDWGTIRVEPTSCKTNIPGIFAGGDCVSGPATLVEALNMGNKAAKSISCYLQGKSYVDEPFFKGLDLGQQRDMGFMSIIPSQKVELLDVQKRLEGFSEVEGSFNISEAMTEAKRCLRCYRLMVWE